MDGVWFFMAYVVCTKRNDSFLCFILTRIKFLKAGASNLACVLSTSPLIPFSKNRQRAFRGSPNLSVSLFSYRESASCVFERESFLDSWKARLVKIRSTYKKRTVTHSVNKTRGSSLVLCLRCVCLFSGVIRSDQWDTVPFLHFTLSHKFCFFLGFWSATDRNQ